MEQQLAGFWFCFYCLPAALKRGASFYAGVYRLLYPWRYTTEEKLCHRQTELAR